MTVVFEEAYYSPQVEERLALALEQCLPFQRDVVLVCIGTDKNLLDCLGPMVGSMLVDTLPALKLYGTLDAPLHAQNLPRLLKDIRSKHPEAIEVAIDASVGSREQVGMIKVRQGGIIPGKAMARQLPEVGDLSITGVVTTKTISSRAGIFQDGSITPVFHMAKTICQALQIWYSRELDPS